MSLKIYTDFASSSLHCKSLYVAIWEKSDRQVFSSPNTQIKKSTLEKQTLQSFICIAVLESCCDETSRPRQHGRKGSIWLPCPSISSSKEIRTGNRKESGGGAAAYRFLLMDYSTCFLLLKKCFKHIFLNWFFGKFISCIPISQFWLTPSPLYLPLTHTMLFPKEN